MDFTEDEIEHIKRRRIEKEIESRQLKIGAIKHFQKVNVKEFFATSNEITEIAQQMPHDETSFEEHRRSSAQHCK